MATTQIKRLYQNSKEFVPITLAEAVVVNTAGMDVVGDQGITTLDNVLRIALNITDNSAESIIALNQSVQTINQTLANKQDKLTAGTGISIVDGVISVTQSTNLALYKIVTELNYPPTKDNLNFIYLYPSNGVSGNVYKEAICYEKDGEYYWEELGSIQSEVNLDGYVTKIEYSAKITEIETSISNINTTLSNTITAANVKVNGQNVVVNYTFTDSDIYESMLSINDGDHVQS